jgi:hypothetical protein
MSGTSARHARGETVTDPAVESAGCPTAVPQQEGTNVVSEELVQRWQAVYREYIEVDRTQRSAPDYLQTMSRLSLTVAATWRDMAATPGLEWWLVATLTTAAEAFDRQARAWRSSQAPSDRPAERVSGPGQPRPGESGFGPAGSGDLGRRG